MENVGAASHIQCCRGYEMIIDTDGWARKSVSRNICVMQ